MAEAGINMLHHHEGGDQSVYLDSFVTEEAPEPENEKKRTVNAIPEM